MEMVFKALLDLPMEMKKNNKDVIASSGYMAPSVVNHLYEALGLYGLCLYKVVVYSDRAHRSFIYNYSIAYKKINVIDYNKYNINVNQFK